MNVNITFLITAHHHQVETLLASKRCLECIETKMGCGGQPCTNKNSKVCDEKI